MSLEQVLQMFDKAEQEFKDLSEKKRIVANDKQKIHRVRPLCPEPTVLP